MKEGSGCLTNRLREAMRRSFVVPVFVVLAGCATGADGPTRYVKADSPQGAGYGYRDKYIGDDEFSIVAEGNRFTSRERAAQIALLRAARVTEARGRTHFVVLNRKSATFQAYQPQMVPLYLGGVMIYIPVGERARAEPIAVLLIRVLPAQSSYPPDAVEAAEAIARLKGRIE
jgi:hypothetical protein